VGKVILGRDCSENDAERGLWGKGCTCIHVPYIQFTNVISAAVEKTQQMSSAFWRMSGSLFQKIPNQHTQKANKLKKKKEKKGEKEENHRQTKQMIKITSLLLLFQNVSLRTTEEVHWGRVMLIVIE